MPDTYTLKALTQCRWANLYETQYQRRDQAPSSWILCSRKSNPIQDAAQPDAVVIVPIVNTPSGPNGTVIHKLLLSYKLGFIA